MGRISDLAFAVGFLCLAAIPAQATEEEDFNAFLTDCDGPKLSYEDAKSCLERARVIDEERPSAKLLAVMRQLERRLEEGDNGETPDSHPAQPATSGPRQLTSPGTLALAPSSPPGDQAAAVSASGVRTDAERDQLSVDLEASRVEERDGQPPKEVEMDDIPPPLDHGAQPADQSPHV